MAWRTATLKAPIRLTLKASTASGASASAKSSSGNPLVGRGKVTSGNAVYYVLAMFQKVAGIWTDRDSTQSLESFFKYCAMSRVLTPG